MSGELSRGLSHELLLSLERHLFDDRQGRIIAETPLLSWQLAVKARQLVGPPDPETDVEKELRQKLANRFISRREMYELFGLYDESPAVRRGHVHALRKLLSIMSLMCYGTKNWVAMDMPHACLTKLGKILPSSFFAPGSWCKKDKWAGECNNSGVIVFQDTIVADGMERTLLDQPEETPHVCELAMFNLAFLLLGRRSFLSDAYQLVRCRSQQELLAIDVARNSIGTDSPLNYFLSIWGSQTHQPIFTRGCLHFGG